VAHALTAAGRPALTLALLIAASVGNAVAAPLVDPTQPPPGYAATQASADGRSAPAAAPDPIRLQMIARNGLQRMAVVNGRRVRAGDSMMFDGKRVKVVSIGDASVVLDQDGHRQILDLNPRSASIACASPSSRRPSCRDDLLGASR